ncbi:MAG: acetyl-CoA carboxylase carboxyltransferase subunit alpha [Deltaproteobacteria bacterium]|nr:acetyl-CoA carboxylase carboxyltransferase subunit alpha [Deltaproteobacteria bacterium]
MPTISHPLEFELPLMEVEAQLESLRDEIAAGNQDKRDEYARLEKRVGKMREDVYGRLSPYQRVQLSRHFDRPFCQDYIKHISPNFVELHGDRLFRDDPAILGGLGKVGAYNVVFVGQQRGRNTSERLRCNFGMPQPEGYRKALRLFKLAEKFNLPVISLIDTTGTYPGIEAEERGQAEAIARNLKELSVLRVPIISVVIGEGGSGGALAIGVADRILMLEYACYSVITPEGCASILWPDGYSESPGQYAAVAAEALKLTANDLKKFGIIDEVVPEPLGGAHRNHREAAELLQAALLRRLKELKELSVSDLLERRYAKYRAIGVFSEN